MTSRDVESTSLPALHIIHKDIEPLEKYAQDAALTATNLTVDSSESLAVANEYVVAVTLKIRQIKERMDFFTKPIKQHVKLIDGVFKRLLDPLERANDTLRNKITRYRAEQQELQRQLAEALNEGRQESLPIQPPTLEQQKSMRTETGHQVIPAQVWNFEIQDIKQIPEEVLRAVVETNKGRDALESVIRARVRSGVRNMPGVRVYKAEQIAVRG